MLEFISSSQNQIIPFGKLLVQKEYLWGVTKFYLDGVEIYSTQQTNIFFFPKRKSIVTLQGNNLVEFTVDTQKMEITTFDRAGTIVESDPERNTLYIDFGDQLLWCYDFFTLVEKTVYSPYKNLDESRERYFISLCRDRIFSGSNKSIYINDIETDSLLDVIDLEDEVYHEFMIIYNIDYYEDKIYLNLGGIFDERYKMYVYNMTTKVLHLIQAPFLPTIQGYFRTYFFNNRAIYKCIGFKDDVPLLEEFNKFDTKLSLVEKIDKHHIGGIDKLGNYCLYRFDDLGNLENLYVQYLNTENTLVKEALYISMEEEARFLRKQNSSKVSLQRILEEIEL